MIYVLVYCTICSSVGRRHRYYAEQTNIQHYVGHLVFPALQLREIYENFPFHLA